MVTSQTGLVDGCCFDYGNAETDSHDDNNGTMEAVYFGGGVVWGTGSPGGHGNGPWVMADLENGVYAGWENNQDQSISTNTPLNTTSSRPWSSGDTADKTRKGSLCALWRATRRPVRSRPSTTEFVLPSPATTHAKAGVDHPRNGRRQQRRRWRAVVRGRDGERRCRGADPQCPPSEHRRCRIREVGHVDPRQRNRQSMHEDSKRSRCCAVPRVYLGRGPRIPTLVTPAAEPPLRNSRQMSDRRRRRQGAASAKLGHAARLCSP